MITENIQYTNDPFAYDERMAPEPGAYSNGSQLEGPVRIYKPEPIVIFKADAESALDTHPNFHERGGTR